VISRDFVLQLSPEPAWNLGVFSEGYCAMRRRRFKQSETLEQRLLKKARRLRDEARLLPPDLTREVALRKARQTETAAHLADWLRSPGLKPPK
jgi:hypothetical protein